MVFLVGIVWAFVRRYAQRPYRIRIKTKPEHLVILTTFPIIGITGFVTEGFRIAALREELGGGRRLREVELRRLGDLVDLLRLVHVRRCSTSTVGPGPRT